MQQFLQKIKRVEPVINTRQQKVDREVAVLNEIKNQKIEIVRSMKDYQKKYMDGVEQLNQQRESKTRDMLEGLESGLDYVKTKWYKLYREVQEIEKRERAQMSIVVDAQIELKAVEKLRGKYQEELSRELKKTDQKLQDETAIRRHAVAG